MKPHHATTARQPQTAEIQPPSTLVLHLGRPLCTRCHKHFPNFADIPGHDCRPTTYRDHADLRAHAAMDLTEHPATETIIDAGDVLRVGREVITKRQATAMFYAGSLTTFRDPYALAEAARLERANAWRRKAGLPER